NLTLVALAVDAPRAVLSAQGDIRAAQADVVGEPAVEEVHERPVLQILPIGHYGARESLTSRGIGGLGGNLQRRRREESIRIAVIAPVVVKGERAQKDRKGRRRGDRAGHRDLREVGAEEIELVLRELEARAERHVGGVEQHVGTTTRLLQERGERGAFAYHFAVEGGGEIDPAVVGAEETHPVPGRQRAGDQFTL